MMSSATCAFRPIPRAALPMAKGAAARRCGIRVTATAQRRVASAAAVAAPAPIKLLAEHSTMTPAPIRPSLVNDVPKHAPHSIVWPPTGLPPTGRAQEALWVLTGPTAHRFGSAEQQWVALATLRDINADVHVGFASLTPAQVESRVRQHFYNVLAAIGGACTAPPSQMAACLSCLATNHAVALGMVAPGGTSAFAEAYTGLPQLLEHAAAMASQLSAAGQHSAALAIAIAGLQLLSTLRFGTTAAAGEYRPAAAAFVSVTTAAFNAGLPVTETAVLGLVEAAASADPKMQLRKWYGHRFATAIDDHITAGFSTMEAALRYTEAWCTLVARGALQPVPALSTRLVAAVKSHIVKEDD